MFLGLYTLYGGIVIVYENIPATFKWVYYTNPGQLLPPSLVLHLSRSHGGVEPNPTRINLVLMARRLEPYFCVVQRRPRSSPDPEILRFLSCSHLVRQGHAYRVRLRGHEL